MKKLGESQAFKEFAEFCRRQAALSGEAEDHDSDAATATPVCNQCGGKGFCWTDRDGYPFVTPCACQQEKIVHNALVRSEIPEKYWQTTLNQKAISERMPFRPYGGRQRDKLAIASQQKALETCRSLRDQYLRVFLEGKATKQDVFGLLLFGKSGRGKTHLVSALLVDLIHAGLRSVRFIEFNKLFKLLRFSIRNQAFTSQDVLDPLLKVKVLVIDDLGTDISSDLVWVLDNIGYIINERYGRNLPTLFTCNYWQSIDQERQEKAENQGAEPKPEYGYSWEATQRWRQEKHARQDIEKVLAAKERVSYRLRSRIREMCLELEVEGFDYRDRIGRMRDMKQEKDRQKRQP